MGRLVGGTTSRKRDTLLAEMMFGLVKSDSYPENLLAPNDRGLRQITSVFRRQLMKICSAQTASPASDTFHKGSEGIHGRGAGQEEML